MNELDYITPPRCLEQIAAQTRTLGFGMASEPLTGALLKTLAASKPASQFLELGTGTGLATAWLLDGMDQTSKLTSVDIDSQVQQVARDYLAHDKRLTLITRDGLEFLKQQQANTFDFIFADAMPGKYEGLAECLKTLKPGGFYVIDDMLPQPNWPEGHAQKIPVLLSELAANPRLTLAPMAWATGLVLAVKQ